MTQHRNTWKEVQLGDHVDLLTGHPFKSKQFTQDGNDIRLLRGDNVAQGFLRWNDAKRWSREEYEAYPSCHLQKGDVILAMDRPWISAGLKYAWIKDRDLPCLLVQRVARLRGTDGLLTEYLRYVVGSHDFTNHVLSITTGVNVPHISGRDIKAFRFKLPPVPVQERAVSILSAYDDLIENNTRRIEILEEMARRLYEEWFVHFRFPGHEAVSFKESELGEIPEGWEVVHLSEVSEYISRGISPKYAESDCRVINQKCIRDNRLNMALSREQIKKVPEAKYVKFGDVLINSTGVGTLGRVAQVYESLENVTVDSHVTIVRPLPEIDFDFFGIGLQILQPYFEGLGVGATGQTELSRVRVGETPVAIPPAELQKKFGELVGPMRRACIKYGVKNTNLRAQRDLLLPKLVSGEIDVSGIPMPDDKEVEAA